MKTTYDPEVHYSVDAMTGEKRPIDPEQFHLDQLNAVLRGMSTTQIADAIAVEVDAVAKKGGGFKTEISAQELYAARQKALWNLGERELEKRMQENEARLAALGTPDEQARARVLRIHQAKLDSRLSLMTAEQTRCLELRGCRLPRPASPRQRFVARLTRSRSSRSDSTLSVLCHPRRTISRLCSSPKHTPGASTALSTSRKSSGSRRSTTSTTT